VCRFWYIIVLFYYGTISYVLTVSKNNTNVIEDQLSYINAFLLMLNGIAVFIQTVKVYTVSSQKV